MVVAGMFGSVICGYILDKTKKFKEVTLGLYFLTAILMFVYTFILGARSLPLIFLVTVLLGESLPAVAVRWSEFRLGEIYRHSSLGNLVKGSDEEREKS